MSITKLLMIAFLVLVWLLIVSKVTWPLLAVGVLLSIICQRLFAAIARVYIYRQAEYTERQLLRLTALPVRIGYLVLFLPVFIYEILHSALRVTKAVINPTSLSPGVIKYELISLHNPFAIALLANLITLTPGTMTMEYDAQARLLFIHALHLDSENSIKQVVGGAMRFEEWVRRILG